MNPNFPKNEGFSGNMDVRQFEQLLDVRLDLDSDIDDIRDAEVLGLSADSNVPIVEFINVIEKKFRQFAIAPGSNEHKPAN